MNEVELRETVHRLNDVVSDWKRLRLSVLTIDIEMKSGLRSEPLSWQEMGPTVLTALQTLQAKLEDTNTTIALKRLAGDQSATIATAAAKALDALSRLQSHYDEIAYQTSATSVANWLSTRSAERGRDRELQLGLELAIEDLMFTETFALSTEAAIPTSKQSGTEQIDLAAQLDLMLNVLVEMSELLNEFFRLFDKIECTEVYQGGHDQSEWNAACESIDKLLVRILRVDTTECKLVLGTWKRDYLRRNQRSEWPFGSDEEFLQIEPPEDALPIVSCEHAVNQWERFKIEIQRRRGFGVLELYRKWNSVLQKLSCVALEVCNAALEGLKSNDLFAEVYKARTNLALGLGLQPPNVEPEASISEHPSEDDGAILINDKIQTSTFELPPAYDDERMFERDRWMYEQKELGISRPEILRRLAEKAPQLLWPLLTSLPALDDGIRKYADAMEKSVPPGQSGNPVNRRKNQANRNRKV